MQEKKIEIPVLNADDFNNCEKGNVSSANIDETDSITHCGESEKGSSKGVNSDIYGLLEDEIMQSDISDGDKAKKLSGLLKIKGKSANIMLVGATGSGKSSTINALFNMDIAKVGVGVSPETESIARYVFGNLTVWDTPGLGDGVDNDEQNSEVIKELLNKTDVDGKLLIDIVVVVLDASSKDLGTSYNLINNILMPCLGDSAHDSIIIALNQSDIAMKGAHWIVEKNEPDEVLKEFLHKKAESVRQRIKDGTGLDITPVCYCAGYKEDGGEQRKPYNLTKLLYRIVKAIPLEKRLALANNISSEKDNWQHDDNEEDYTGKTKRSFCDTLFEFLSDGAENGAEIGGEILGIPGKIVGGIMGCAIGIVTGFFAAIFS